MTGSTRRQPTVHRSEGESSARPKQGDRFQRDVLTLESLRHLQRTVGNRGVTVLIAKSRPASGPTTPPWHSLQRFTDEDVKKRAYYNWEKKGRPQQDQAAQDADYFEARKQLQAELKAAFSKALDDKKSLDDIKKLLADTTNEQRKPIWSDAALMSKAHTAVGKIDFMALVVELGMTYSGNVPHKTGAEADKLIRDKLGKYVAEAVKAGVKVEGQIAVLDDATWKKVYTAQFPKDKPEEELETNAFVAGRHPSRPIILHKDRGNPGTSIHEGMHKYSNTALRDLSIGINEGVTEYFTRLVTNPLKIDRANYEPNYSLATKLCTLVGGQDKLAAVYFDGQVAQLKKAFVELRQKKEETDKIAVASWKTFLLYIKGKEWSEAESMLK